MREVKLPPEPKHLEGKFGHWTVLRFSHIGVNRLAYFLCRCDCGTEKSLNGANLRAGRTKSCRVCAYKYRQNGRTVHGESNSITYTTWVNMKQRCLNPKVPQWMDYGGRGITICDRWRHSYAAFVEDMGERPSKAYSIERIDNDGHYEPGNCKWATRREQQANMSLACLIKHNGEECAQAEWARRLGISQSVACTHFNNGRTVADIIAMGHTLGPRTY